MTEKKPADVPDDLIEAGLGVLRAWYADNPAANTFSSSRQQVRQILTATLPLHREQIAAELEAYAESIGWHEAGGVWADAIAVIKREPWTQGAVKDGSEEASDHD